MANVFTFDTIKVDMVGDIADLRLARPEVLNAINSTMIADLHAALDRLEADPSVRAIVVSGEGRAFSAGFDLKESAARGDTTAQQWRHILEKDFGVIMRFWDSPKPTIAAVHGACVGGAFELALACDLSVAARGARMGEPEVRFGSGIVALLLPWMTGPKQAKELLLAGIDNLDAERALELGLVNRVVDPDQLREEALLLARSIAAGGMEAVRLTKMAVNRTYETMGMRQALLQALEIDINLEAAGGPERTEFNRIRKESGLKEAIAWRQRRNASVGG